MKSQEGVEDGAWVSRNEELVVKGNKTWVGVGRVRGKRDVIWSINCALVRAEWMKKSLHVYLRAYIHYYTKTVLPILTNGYQKIHKATN